MRRSIVKLIVYQKHTTVQTFPMLVRRPQQHARQMLLMIKPAVQNRLKIWICTNFASEPRPKQKINHTLW